MYRVIWLQTALNQLAEIWIQANADDRREINDAVRRIDGLLASNPSGIGESRDEGLRICFVAGLSVGFSYDQTAKTAAVLTIRRMRPRRGTNGRH